MFVQKKGLAAPVIRALVRPLVRVCLAYSVHLQELLEIIKAELISAARSELQQSGKRASVSRLSVVTGLHRKDIDRLSRADPDTASRADLATKVIGQWQTDKNFLTKSGQPRVLTIGSDQSSFSRLARSVSKELSPATIMFELERIGAIEVVERGIRLRMGSYTPRGDLVAGTNILSADIKTLIAAVLDNLTTERNLKNLHARTEFDNIRPAHLTDIAQWLITEGHAFHARAREFLARFDQDITPDPNFRGAGTKVSITSFAFAEEKSSK